MHEDVGLPSHKTLFQLQAERICKLQELAREHAVRRDIPVRAGPLILWCIMTSDSTHDDTVAYFVKNNFFGLSQVRKRYVKLDNVCFRRVFVSSSKGCCQQ